MMQARSAGKEASLFSAAGLFRNQTGRNADQMGSRPGFMRLQQFALALRAGERIKAEGRKPSRATRRGNTQCEGRTAGRLAPLR